jgi:hypothetical protein
MADIVKDLTQYRIRGIEKAEIEYYKQLTETLDRIESQIVSLADRELPRQAGKLIELQSAVAIRPKIKAILDKEYLPFADKVVRKGFGEQAKRVERQFKTIGLIPPEFQELTKGDLALVQNLKQQYYTQFKDVSNNFTRVLSDKVYQNTLVGTEFTVLEKELRESINGIYATSNDPAINRLVDYVKNNRDNPALASRVDSAIKILQTKYASTRVGENMKRYAGQILNDSLRDFDATLNLNKAKDAELTYVKYYGDVIPTTRSLCRNMINGVYDRSGKGIYTLDDITRIWNSNSWSGKKGGTPMVNRGGYNCRHQFSYVNPDWYEEDGEESNILKEATPIIKKESKINVTSFANPITLANIRTVPKSVSQARVTKSVTEGLKDKRYPLKPDGTPYNRFRNSELIGTSDIGLLSDEMATKVSVVFDELNDLAVKYNVPKLRGISTFSRKGGNLASMGDGTLKLNARSLHKTKEGVAIGLRRLNIENNTNFKIVPDWKQGDKIGLRPRIGYQYFDNDLDQIRQIMYHEFGHHVHQMRYVSQLQGKAVESTYTYGYSFIPEVERKITKIANRSFPTGYAKTNGYEWFAENFSLYNMKKVDLVDPEFIKLIKEIQ